MKKITIFISSPGDVEHERKICKKVLDQMNAMLGPHFDVYLEPYFWETSASSVGMGTPQSRIPSPENFDVYIGILWKRFGTPTGERNPVTGKLNKSGTITEFTQAYEAWKKTGHVKPEIKFLHKRTEETPELLKDRQYLQVKNFLKDFRVNGEHPGIYYTFDNDAEFESAIQRYIMDYVMEFNRSTRLPRYYLSAGITDLFLNSDNEGRNRSKSEDLAHADHIRLIAHSGNSYLNSTAQRYFDKVEDCLRRGGLVEVIVANPYSEMGYYITLGDTNRYHATKTMVAYLRESKVDQTVDKIDFASWVAFKLNPSIDGFLALRSVYGDRIRLKLCSYEINSTILLTERVAYYEPYMHCAGSEHSMNAFEIRVQREYRRERNNFFDTLSEHFNLLWEISEDYESYVQNKERYKKALRERMVERAVPAIEV